MNVYIDTSVLVAALTNEAETERMQSWLARQTPDDLFISDWVATEFSSALSIKLRAAQITVTDRANALALFTRLSAESFELLPVTTQQFKTAARFSDQYTLGLRAGDALHLAICADHGATLCTLDRRLAEARPHVGLRTELL
ncbi:type II toxin-antitoxin system VapC family toxin (plasmid) [Acetobacter sp. AC2005]|uniref:type II toxin-antitoxin system VapC family toxin n=1 Tax=Acetobacter sp. AC2005 TaxID=3134142 RepID=UPI0030CBA4FF